MDQHTGYMLCLGAVSPPTPPLCFAITIAVPSGGRGGAGGIVPWTRLKKTVNFQHLLYRANCKNLKNWKNPRNAMSKNNQFSAILSISAMKNLNCLPVINIFFDFFGLCVKFCLP